jgi:uncharacterized membrane protein
VTQQDLNDLEWKNPDNWSQRGLLGLYFSKKDSRIVVPKAMPSLGWTLNLAHQAGALSLIGALLLPTFILVGIIICR